jgi:microsomal epoxide hydrolase
MGRPEGMTDDALDAYEREGIERMNTFKTMGGGYSTEHGTRPSTIGHVISSSPMALLAWYGINASTVQDQYANLMQGRRKVPGVG